MKSSGFKRLSSVFYRWIPFLLILLTYPVAVFVPVQTWLSLVFYISIPSAFLMTLLAVHHLAVTPSASIRGIQWKYNLLYEKAPVLVTAGSVTLCLLLAFVSISTDTAAVVQCVGMFVVPVYFAVCPKRFVSRYVPGLFSLVWVLYSGHMLYQFFRDFTIAGLAGNPNWAAPVLIVASGWTVTFLSTLCKRKPMLCFVFQALVCVLTGFLIFQTGCRASFLVVSGFVVCYGFLPKLSVPARVLACFGGGVLLVMVIIFGGDLAAKQVEEDIRLPLWGQTIRMIREYPIFGVGPGNFERRFVVYRSDAQKRRRVAANVTQHPHNEFLHMLAQTGVPAGLGWLAMVVWALLPPKRHRTRFGGVCRFSAFVIVGHAMFDKQLFMAPTNLICWMFLGLAVREKLKVRTFPEQRSESGRKTMAILGLFFVCLAAVVSWKHVYRSLLFRRAYIAEMENRNEDAYEAYRKSTEVEPGNVRTHAFAGICADNRLNDPEKALKHLQDALELDPNFAHINGQIGSALMKLGHPEKAVDFLKKEVDLYPYDPVACAKLILCLQLFGDTGNLEGLYQRLENAVVKQLNDAMDGTEQMEHSVAFVAALRAGNPQMALNAANALTPDCPRSGTEPILVMNQDVFREMKVFVEAAQFLPEDLPFWHGEAFTAYVVAENKIRSFEDVVKVGVSRDVLLKNRLFDREGVPDSFGDRIRFLRALNVSRVASAVGMKTLLILQEDGSFSGVIQLTKDKESVLVDPEKRVLKVGDALALQFDETLQSSFGIDGDLRKIHCLVPVSPFQCLMRNQVLSMALKASNAGRVPVEVQSPHRLLHEMMVWREEIMQQFSESGEKSLVRPEMSLYFAPYSLRVLEQSLETNKPKRPDF